MDTGNRQWDTPRTPWIMRQSWHDLLFMHWPVAESVLRPLIPAALEIESFGGSAWIGVVPFRMSGIRARWLPPVPGLSAMPELNVRTYVRLAGTGAAPKTSKPGVWFFSLDAASALAVRAARRFYRLPYFRARMSCQAGPGRDMHYQTQRTHPGAPAAEFRGRYRATGPVSHARPGSLEFFLTERYCLYAAHRGRLYRAEIDHPAWPLQPAEAAVEANTMARAAGILLPEAPPLLHFARFQDVRVWPLRPVRDLHEGTR